MGYFCHFLLIYTKKSVIIKVQNLKKGGHYMLQHKGETPQAKAKRLENKVKGLGGRKPRSEADWKNSAVKAQSEKTNKNV